MTWQRSVQAAVRSLKREETALQKKLEVVRGKIAELSEVSRTSGATGAGRKKTSRRLSAQGRAAISRAAKKRWSKYRAEQRAKGRKARSRA
jgi:hypothetical protein